MTQIRHGRSQDPSFRQPRPSSCSCAWLRRSRPCGNSPSLSASSSSASGSCSGSPQSCIASASSCTASGPPCPNSFAGSGTAKGKGLWTAPELLLVQCCLRIHSCRTLRREPRCQQRNSQEQSECPDKRHRIGRLHADEQRLNETAEQDGQQKPGDHSHQRKTHSCEDNEAHDVPSLRA